MKSVFPKLNWRALNETKVFSVVLYFLLLLSEREKAKIL